MTVTAPARSRGLPATLRVGVALAAMVTIVLVGLAGLFASAASAQTLARPGNAVGAFGAAGGQVVGAHQPVLAGQRRARAPSYDRLVVGSCVAAESSTLELPAAETWGRPETLADHFARHGADFGGASEEAYAHEASSFFQRGLQDELPTKISPKDGAIRIYDPGTNTFGSYNANGTTRTFYKPDPASHGFATNWDYWVSQSGYSPWGP